MEDKSYWVSAKQAREISDSEENQKFIIQMDVIMDYITRTAENSNPRVYRKGFSFNILPSVERKLHSMGYVVINPIDADGFVVTWEDTGNK